MVLIDTLQQWLALILAVAGAIGGYLRWRATRKKSTDMLFEELENIKQKLVAQISNEIRHAEEKAKTEIEVAEKNRQLEELERTLESLKAGCPDCYERVIKRTT